MTQLALLLALGLLGLVLSFGFGRLEVKRAAVSMTVKRAEGALERASLSLLRVGATRGLGLLLIPALGLTAFALLSPSAGSVSGLGRAAFSTVSLLAGALSTLVHARLALGLGARAASSAAAAGARGSVLAMRPLIRAAVATAVFGEGLGLLGLAAAFGSLYAVRGGFANTQPSAALAVEVVQLLPAYALGAAVSALTLAREGSVAGGAARVGGTQAAELESELLAGDARDPALLARLMGQLVGELLPTALSTYVCGMVASVSAALLAVSGSASESHLAWFIVFVLVRLFGALGSVCGVLAARVTDEEPVINAVFRGQVSACVVALFGLGAALFWVTREHWGSLFLAGAVGLLVAALVAQGAGWPLRRRISSGRDTQLSNGDASSIVRGVGSGFSSAWPTLLAPAAAFAALERGLSPHTPSGLVLICFGAGALALLPFSASLAGFGVLASHTRGLIALARLEHSPRAAGHTLQAASALGHAAGSTHASLALALSSLLGLVSLASAPGAPTRALGASSVAVMFGVALVLLCGARAAQSAVAGARLVTAEAERQLRDARPPGSPTLPADFTPSYKACVDAALAAARNGSVIELSSLLFAPFVLCSLLRWGGVPAGAATLASFGVAAVTAGLIFTLGGRATRAVLGEQRPRLGAQLSPPQAQSFGDVVGVTAATSVEALALVLALTVLCLAPLLR